MFLVTDSVIPASNYMMLWVGQLGEAELLAYVDEPGDRIDGQPQSKFAEDLRWFYDHDFLWAQASPKSGSIRDLAHRIGIQDAELVDELESRVVDIEPISCFLILWNYRNVRRLTQQFANGKLRFVGSWAYPAPYTDDWLNAVDSEASGELSDQIPRCHRIRFQDGRGVRHVTLGLSSTAWVFRPPQELPQ
jgi:hypothetical protein